ncbi:helix-turn-helix DNA binding protein [Mycobacterium phage Philonius]|uniref:Helix-turn-helix DNA binding protein n=1 Tax=Mycobacterium phage Philonius TaxID=2047843 RepID=A0A2H4PD18_9CAUD|nr:helix-turn-helix DNA binding protein [Mycobacterium phage Philonius]ATW60127.1 helix-turn-helix DNA binding protein [Mycobacterium phage Philonius]
MSMNFHLTRAEQTKLREKLASVPELAEDLAVTITRQARIQKPNLGKPRRQRPEPCVPFHLGASEAADELQRCLAVWVRFVCDARQIEYTDTDDLASLARWLHRNVVTLALIEGSETAYTDIAHRIDECRRQIDLPPEDEIVIDRARLEQANRQIVTAGQAEKIARKLGDLGRRLTTQRVHSLNRRGHLRPVGTDPETGTKFYRLGDILQAHLKCAQRQRRS